LTFSEIYISLFLLFKKHMILGQLYYYHKVLDQFSFPVNLENIEKLEILGIPKVSKKNYEDLNQIEISRKIRDEFSANFPQILKENKLNFALSFWLELTSPIKKEFNIKVKPTSDFQQKLLEWNNRGGKIEDIEELIRYANLLNQEEDLAIFYGIKVLYLLTKISQTNLVLNLSGAKINQEIENLSWQPEILVITKNFFSPLFVNINCQFLLEKEEENNKDLTKRIEQVLDKPNNIKLILLVTLDPKKEAKIDWLQKHLTKEILITSIDLEKNNTSSDQTFFDKIVKKTLGVRLTTN
jgi:hypothetical protein